jgi:hypothetical protein
MIAITRLSALPWNSQPLLYSFHSLIDVVRRESQSTIGRYFLDPTMLKVRNFSELTRTFDLNLDIPTFNTSKQIKHTGLK